MGVQGLPLGQPLMMLGYQLGQYVGFRVHLLGFRGLVQFRDQFLQGIILGFRLSQHFSRMGWLRGIPWRAPTGL